MTLMLLITMMVMMLTMKTMMLAMTAAGVDALTDLVDNAGRIHPRNVRRRIGLLGVGPRTVADVGVGGVDRRCFDP